MSNLLKQLTDHTADLHKTAEMNKTAEERFADAVCDELQKLGCDEMEKEAVLKALKAAWGGVNKFIRPVATAKKALEVAKVKRTADAARAVGRFQSRARQGITPLKKAVGGDIWSKSPVATKADKLGAFVKKKLK